MVRRTTDSPKGATEPRAFLRPLAGLALGLLVLSPLLGACSSDDSSGFDCVQDLDLSCAPQHDPPTFQAIFDNTLHPTCASGRGTCHTADAQMGGLVFEDIDQSYDLLLGNVDGRARVMPGDPSCSLIVERLEADTPATRMPPASQPLPAAERCTIEQWIAQGAQR